MKNKYVLLRYTLRLAGFYHVCDKPLYCYAYSEKQALNYFRRRLYKVYRNDIDFLVDIDDIYLVLNVQNENTKRN